MPDHEYNPPLYEIKQIVQLVYDFTSPKQRPSTVLSFASYVHSDQE